MGSYIGSIPTPPRMMSESEQAALLRVTGQRRDGLRDHVLIALALGTGLREHELVALNVGDLLGTDGKVRRQVELRVFKRSAKRPAPQSVLLNETLRTKLARYLRQMKRDADAETPLFVSRKGNRLSTRQVRHLFGVWQERAGIERRFSFHCTRHAACGNLYRRTKDIRIVQRFARHASVLSTMRYSHPDEAELVRALQDLPC